MENFGPRYSFVLSGVSHEIEIVGKILDTEYMPYDFNPVVHLPSLMR